jgi:hypothetical protein
LAHLLADRLKLRYSDKLYADLGNLLKRRVRRIRGLHRLEGYRSKWRRLLVFRVIVRRFARTRRYSDPTPVLCRQLDVRLRSRPQGILQCGIRILG